MKKPAASKRTNLPRRVDYARQFVKDWERLSRSGRYDMKRLKAVMLLLITNDTPLGLERKDHALKGVWANHRECHVGGDFLLIYRIDDTDGPSGSVYFTRVGTHAELSNDGRQKHPLRLRHLRATRRTSRGGPRYSDLAIETCLTLHMAYRLGLRQTQGLMGSIGTLMGLDIRVPDYATLSGVRME